MLGQFVSTLIRIVCQGKDGTPNINCIKYKITFENISISFHAYISKWQSNLKSSKTTKDWQ